MTTWAAAEVHVWVHGPPAAEASVDVPGPCCSQGPHGCLGSGPQPVTMLVSEGCTAVGVRQTWVINTVNWGHGLVWARVVDKGHVWVHDPAIRVCADVCGS